MRGGVRGRGGGEREREREIRGSEAKKLFAAEAAPLGIGQKCHWCNRESAKRR